MNERKPHPQGPPQTQQIKHPVVILTPSEIMMAAQVGVMRHVQNIKRKVKEAYGASPDKDWQYDIEGALGEYALAKYLNRCWGGTGEYRAPDVCGVDVRTSSKDWGDLILHPKDPDTRIFFLLTGLNGRYTVRGWCYAKEGKKDQHWKDPAGGRPAYFYPQTLLRQGKPPQFE